VHEWPRWVTDGSVKRQARQAEARAAWRLAGDAWSRERGLGPGGWRELLPPEVRYAVSALGREHIRKGGLVPPWEA
jgi:hypothetical protein